MTDELKKIYTVLTKQRFNLHLEASLQDQMAKVFTENNISFQREHIFDKKNRVDFFIGGVAIEVKIKGSSRNIYKQVERYSKFEEVNTLILVTNRSMGFPNEISGKPCYLISLGKAWL